MVLPEGCRARRVRPPRRPLRVTRPAKEPCVQRASAPANPASVSVHRRARRCAGALLALLGLSLALAGAGAPFLVFHVDAVARLDLLAMLEAGRLPNVEAAFAEGVRIPGVTLFLAATPVIYPRLHDPQSEHGPGRVGFCGFDRVAERPVSELEVFLELLGAVPRRAVTSFVHGIPGLDGLSAASMRNLPALLERYEVVEFFWFSTDALGHLVGAEAHAASLERFDAALGRILSELDLERLNLLLYTDHGLTFTTEMVDQDAIVRERLGSTVRHVAYPNVYLHDPRQAPSAARALAADGGFDTAFYRLGDDVEGFVDGEFVRFERVGETIRYSATGDPLGYAELGYGAEALTCDEWLRLTIDARYPGTPVLVSWYLANPQAGDVVVTFTPPRIPLTTRATQGQHAGLVDTDLGVLVLARGPDLTALMGREALWLHELYLDLPVVREAPLPERELHTLGLSFDLERLAPSAELRWSPAYRQRLGVALTPTEADAWAEVDLFSSYLTRWWVGGGLRLDVERGLDPLVRAEATLDLGPARLALTGCGTPTGWSLGLALRVALDGGWGATWSAPAAVGVSVEW